MDFNFLISIIGAMLTATLAINAFFLRGISQDLNAVRIQMAKMFENSKAKERRISTLEDDSKEIKKNINDIVNRITLIEGK